MLRKIKVLLEMLKFRRTLFSLSFFRIGPFPEVRRIQEWQVYHDN